jgi:hypothetical protein
MEYFFRFTTPVIYLLLVIIWTYIFAFYIKKVKNINAYNKLLKLLLIVLAIDAFRSLFESMYFGAWYTSLSGLIPIEIFNYLAKPQIVFFPKIINLIAAILILTILIKKWLSSEITQNNELNTLIEKQTSEIRLINKDIIKAKEIIEISEEKFSKAFYDNALAMEIIDLKNGERIDFNNNFCELTEYSKSELSKKGFGELQLIKEIDSQNELLNELTTKGFSNNKSLRILTKSGKLKNVILNASVLNIKDQKTAIISFVDITKQKEIEEKNMKLSAAVEQSPESIIITNTKGIIEYVNPHFTKLTGYSFKEAIGQNPNLLKSGDQNDAFYKDLWDTITIGNVWKGEFQNKKKNGEEYWEYASIAPITNQKGEITSYIAIKEDITEKNKISEDLIIAKEKAEESDRLKTEFLNNMSHEIRTPLNGILGFSKMLEKEDLPLEKKTQFIDIIHDGGERLIRVIEDIVDISMIESNQLEITKMNFNLSDLLNNVVLHFTNSNLFKVKSKLSLKLINTIDPLFNINSDKIRLIQILDNLISNAIKYSNEGVIEIACEILNNKQVEIYVKDNGDGIPEHDVHKLFKRFCSIETDKIKEGTGIGLAISKGIVDLMGGKIWHEPNQPKGSIFKFNIPIEITTKIESNIKKNTSEKLVKNSNKILYLAEDDPISMEFIKEALSETGLELQYANDGNELLALIEKKTPDIILLDIKMPNLDGFEALSIIRKKHPDLPVIAQTAHAMDKEKARIKKVGFTDYIAKPIFQEELISLINKYL